MSSNIYSQDNQVDSLIKLSEDNRGVNDSLALFYANEAIGLAFNFDYQNGLGKGV